MAASRPRRLYANESVGFTCTEPEAPTANATGTIPCTVDDVDRVTVVWIRVTIAFE
jgi:hypothetical protein